MNVQSRATLDRDQATEWASWFQALDVGQSTVSHHLAKLAEVRFLIVEHVGTSSLWRINSACIAAFPSAAEMVMGRVPIEFTEAMECEE